MEIKLDGFSELERELDKLKKTTGKGVLRRSLKKASVPLAEKANQNSPVLTGDLSVSFIYSTKLNKRQSSMHKRLFRNDRAAVEGFVGSNDPAAIQQEFGNINHGAQPSLRPAWDSDQDFLLKRLGGHLWDEFAKSLKRVNKNK